MALTTVDYHVLEALRRSNLLPPRPNVLELGESEWYADATADESLALIDAVVSDPARREPLRRRLRELLASKSPHRHWDLAKVFYAALLDFRGITAIDFHGTPAARRLDLNQPLELGERYDIVIDSGTAEHVFNVLQFFKTCHEVTRPGGLMLHNNPFRGWLEHGFYNFNPTFYWDLAGANRYELLMLVYHEAQPLRIEQLATREKIVEMARAGELGAHAMLYAVYRKPADDAPFAIPWQGYYGGGLSRTMVEAWGSVR